MDFLKETSKSDHIFGAKVQDCCFQSQNTLKPAPLDSYQKVTYDQTPVKNAEHSLSGKRYRNLHV